MNFVKKAYKDFVTNEREVCLYFDLTEIEKKFSFLNNLTKDNVKFIFPVKSFPKQEIFSLAQRYLNGFDVSNQNEFDLIKKHISSESLIWSSAPFFWKCDWNSKLIFDVQEVDREVEGHIKSLRINGNFLGDTLRSRFGVELQKDIPLEKHGILAIHIHHGIDEMTKDHYLRMIRALAELVRGRSDIKFINLGGGFTYLSDEEIVEVVDVAKSELRGRQILFEPGRWFTINAGYCFGQIKEIIQRENSGQIITSISRDCHLRWMNKKFPVDFIEVGSHRVLLPQVVLSGPTCYEGDKICEISRLGASYAREDIVIVGGVSGYSVAWNTTFNGISAAPVVIL